MPSNDDFVKDLAGRVGRLETDLGGVRTDVSAIKTKIDHVPTRAELYLVGLSALTALVYALWQIASGPLAKSIAAAVKSGS